MRGKSAAAQVSAPVLTSARRENGMAPSIVSY